MEYRIVEKLEFAFAGVSRRVPLQFEGVNNAIVKLAESITPEQRKEMHRLQDTMTRIYSEWFLTADYELANSLSFSFTKMDSEREGYAYSEVWIPVRRKV